MVVHRDFGRDVRRIERGSGVLQVTQLSVVGRAGESLRSVRINYMRV